MRQPAMSMRQPALEKAAAADRPFDALYGYSQGGGLAALVGAHLAAKHATGFAAMLISLLSWMAQ